MKNEGWKKRQAIHIASQLPENTEDALAVLRYAMELVTEYLSEDSPQAALGSPPMAPIRSLKCVQGGTKGDA